MFFLGVSAVCVRRGVGRDIKKRGARTDPEGMGGRGVGLVNASTSLLFFSLKPQPETERINKQ